MPYNPDTKIELEINGNVVYQKDICASNLPARIMHCKAYAKSQKWHWELFIRMPSKVNQILKRNKR